MKLKVLSWNIWINGYFDKVTSFLKTSNADVIGLQEVVSGNPERDVIGFLGKLGYKHVLLRSGILGVIKYLMMARQSLVGIKLLRTKLIFFQKRIVVLR